MHRVKIIALSFLLLTAVSIPCQGSEHPRAMTDVLDNIVETFEVHDTPIEDVLRLLASQNDLNLIIGPDSMGSISLRFSSVTLESALDAMLQAKGYKYIIHENIMLVTQPDSLERVQGLGRETRYYKLKYADARDVRSTIDTSRVLSPWGRTTIAYRSFRTDAVRAYGVKPGLDFIEGRIINLEDPISYSTTPLQSRSDVIIITDIPSALARAEKLIEQLDHPVQQIAIEVHFIETILGDDQQLGIDWYNMLSVDGSYQGRTNWQMGGLQTDPATLEQFGGILQVGSLNSTKFAAVLQTLVEKENSKLLSQPSITTMDNQPATITVGITTWIEERSGSITNNDLQITYRERQVPIELIVVPHIQHDDLIMLELRPRVEEITGFQQGAGNFQLPLISTRTADSRVQVKDGETAVIGGLITEKNRIVDKKVWGLSSIPMIGNLFKHQVHEKDRSNLSIFITTRILRGEQYGGIEDNSDAKDPGRAEFESRKSAFPEPKIPMTLASKDVPKMKTTLAESDSRNKRQKVKPKPSVDPRLIVDLRNYFPLDQGKHWGYRWRQSEGESWESELTVSGILSDVALVAEEVPSGPRKSSGRTAYVWDESGMLNTYRINGDSTVFDPPRIIIPAEMIKGRTYKNEYEWKRWRDGKNVASDKVEQHQRIVGKYAVSTGVGRFKDCVAVETVWFDPTDTNAEKKRKVVWYAPEMGPVKVEYDIPIDAPALQGDLSALLVKQ